MSKLFFMILFLSIDSQDQNSQLANLEVKITPPKFSQKKLDDLIQKQIGLRQKKEKNLMNELKQAFEEEILQSGKLISSTIDYYFQFLMDPNVIQKIQNYKFLDNMVLQPQNHDANSQQFKIIQDHVASIFQLDQKDTEPNVEKLSDEQKKKLQSLIKDDKVDDKTKSDIKQLLASQTSFLSQIESQTDGVMVNLHKSKDIDPQVYQLIEALESDRQKLENQIFSNTKDELKLITKQTILELKKSLESNLFTIYALINNFQFDKNSMISKKILNLELMHFCVKNKDKISERFPLLFRNLQQIAKKMNNETDESVSFKSSPFENFDKEPELDFIDNVKSQMNEQLLNSSFLQLDNNVFSLPGQNINLKFSSSKEFPTLFKIVTQLESLRDDVEEYEINQLIKIEQQLQQSQVEIIKQAIKQKLSTIQIGKK